MARMARVVIPGYPHHITQRGNRRQETFFNKNDYQVDIGLMAEWCTRSKVAIWAYCLMSNHVSSYRRSSFGRRASTGDRGSPSALYPAYKSSRELERPFVMVS